MKNFGITRQPETLAELHILLDEASQEPLSEGSTLEEIFAAITSPNYGQKV